MNTKQNNVGWGFWLRWVVASFLGFVVGGVVGGFAGYAIDEFGIAGLAVFGAMFGAIGGVMQWLVLRRHVAQTGGWVVATAVGYTLAGITTALIFRLFMNTSAALVGIVAFGAVAGVVGGIMQWLVLRRNVARAGWWVLASILGLVVGMGVGAPVAMALGQAGHVIESTVVFGILFGAGVGAIPGAALVWLLRQSESGSSAGTAAQGAR